MYLTLGNELRSQPEDMPCYIVHAVLRHGAHMITFDDPAKALQAMERLLRHGAYKVRITNAAHDTIPTDDVRLLAGL